MTENPFELSTENESNEIEKKATETLAEVQELVSKLSKAESQLEHGYATLGILLTAVSENKYWQHAGYTSFSQYMTEISNTYKIGRTQLYAYKAITKTLLEQNVTEDELVAMGPTKAKVLQQSAKAGQPVTREAIDAAVDPKVTVQDVQKLLFAGEDVKHDGEWRNLGSIFGSPTISGFYANEDEWTVIRDVLTRIKHTDPVIPKEHPGHMQFKETLLRLCMEYLATNPEEK